MTRPSVFGPDMEALKSQEPSKAVELVEQRDVIKTSTYLPKEVYERLREIAFHERCKIHDLLIEGLDHVLTKRRHPTVEELKGRTKG